MISPVRALFHPAVALWFEETFPSGPTGAQRRAWPAIASGESILLVSPTGSGKTLAAFLVALDAIVKRREAGDLTPRLTTLYISPLKALDNDIARNLDVPRAGIRRHLETLEPGRGVTGTSVSMVTAVRTGDTTAAARAAQVKTPPDILITTPESLYLMLTGAARRIFGGVTTVILDEVHSIAGTKRGTHLMLTLERLEALIEARGGPPPARIALSATVHPAARVAAFVGGVGRTVRPIVVQTEKRLDLTVVSPLLDTTGKPEEGSAWGPAVEAIAAEIEGRRTTLVFCNNRRHAERVASLLAARTGLDVPTHHGSIARAPREEIERRLKAGEVRALVATGSLELGIDIGAIDSVVQLSSPKGIARALQRVGRSGHLVGETSRGRFVPLFLDDLFDCAATIEGMRAGDVEETRPPENPLDVLAQQLVAESVALAADGASVTSAQLFACFRRADPYRALSRRLFDETLGMLSGKYPRERFAELAPKLVWDRATDRVSPLPAARLAAILDGGTIADRGAYKAVLPDLKTVVGELDEEFVYETRAGDVFLLGSHAWRTLEITHDRVVVEDATGQPARMPFWRGEGLGRAPRLGERIGALKRTIAERLGDSTEHDREVLELLKSRYGCDDGAAATLLGAVRRERLDPGGVSSDQRIVFETFPNDLGDPCILVRSLFGRGVNLPWSLALAAVLREETGLDVESVAADDGILLRLPRAEREVPLERLSRMTAKEARERLLSALPNTSMFGARFRENAQRALLLPRVRTGRRTPFWLQRLKARDLLQTTRNLPEFPIVAETYRDCLKDLWEYDRLLVLLDDLESGKVERALDVRRFPSPTGASLLFNFVMAYMYEWDAPKAEKGLHALAMNRELLGEVLGEAIDDGIRPEAAASARADASRLAPRRKARGVDELLLVFQELGDLTRDETIERTAGDGDVWLDELIARGSVVPRSIGGEPRLVTAEESADWDRLGADAGIRDRILLRFFATRGPASALDAALRFGLEPSRVEESLDRLRLDGLVVSGSFGEAAPARLWAGARLTETIRRRTLSLLRNEIRPVPAAAYRSFLARRLGAEIGSRFRGPDGAERAMALLRGLPLPALSWETTILPARLAETEPDALDALSARGLLVWRAIGTKDPRAARLAFFLRGEGELALPPGPPDLSLRSTGARALFERLAVAGASFAADLTTSLGITPPELDRALMELALAGLVTGDGLQGLRELLRAGGRKLKAKDAGPIPPHSIGQSPGRAALRAAEARVAARLGVREKPRGGRTESTAWGRSGRWSLLAGPGVSGEALGSSERAESWARILLSRWGVVSRGTLEAEDSSVVRWSDVAPVLSRMEMRGDLRRGEFVEGNGPMQYAEEETVDALRAARDRKAEPHLAIVSGADPIVAGLEGISTPARDELIALSSGEPVVRLDSDGTLRLGEPSPTDRLLRDALMGFQELKRRGRDPLGRPRRLVVSHLGAEPVTGTRIVPLLESIGFHRDGPKYVFRAL